MLYSENKRSDYIDVLKAMAIFCVLLGHCELTCSFLRQLIYSFHMPAFFVAYGLSYHYELYLDNSFLTKKFIYQKFQRLLIPCFSWGIIYAQLNAKNLVYLLYGSQRSFNSAGSLSSLWFLPCMFCAANLFEGMITVVYRRKNNSKEKLLSDISMIVIAIGTAYISTLVPRLKMGYPFSIDVSLMGFSFIVFGYIIKKLIMKITFLNKGNILFYSILLLLAAVVVLITFKNNLVGISTSNVDMASGNYGNLLLFFVDGGVGTIALICISVFILKLPFKQIKDALLWIGQNTLLIFVLHKPLVIQLGSLVYRLGFSQWYLTFPICICAMVICIVLSIVIKKYAPMLSGEVFYAKI